MFKNRLLDGVLVLAATAFAACGVSGSNGIGQSDAGISEEDAGADGGSSGKATASKKKTKAATPKDAGAKQDEDKQDAASGDEEDASTAEEPKKEEPKPDRPQDARKFTIDEAALAFEALPDADAWHGKLGNAGYRIEVPKNWNGILVMYAHGYGGTGNALGVTTPSIRQHLIENGYAWAASSYSTNYYDVRAGVEDTNELALEFTKIAEENGRKLDEPRKRYVMGHSMGGHVAGAAIEREAHETAIHKVD